MVKKSKTEIIERLDDIADSVVRKTRHLLPTLGRFCLVATFLEDGIRLCSQWSDQVYHLNNLWGTFKIFPILFLIINIVGQIAGSIMVLIRYNVKIACGILMGVVVLQTVGYHIWSLVFLTRNLSLMGSLLLLLAESNEKIRPVLAGLPTAGESEPKKYLLLGGRLMVVLIFLTQLNSSGGLIYFLQVAANLVFILLVAVGFRTKLCAMILVIWLFIMNCWYNAFWTSSIDSFDWDYLKYDFFQTLSVIGGLLLIVAYGPGGMSMDDYKKNR